MEIRVQQKEAWNISILFVLIVDTVTGMLEIYSHAVVFMVMKLNDIYGMQVRL